MRRSYSAFIITSLLILIVISSFISTHLPAKVAAKSLSLSSAPIPASGTIYTATGSTLVATNTTDGSTRWSNQNVSSCIDISGPVIDEKNSIVYLMDHDGSCTPGIYAVNASTGQSINGANGSPPLLPIPNISSYQPTIDNTGSLVKIVVYTTDNKMSSYKIDGTLLWSYQLSSTVTTTPIVANGNIYFGTADGHIEVLNDNTTSAQGALVGSYAISSGFTISTDLLIYNQALYFGTTQNGNTNTNVFALDISTSQPALKWNVQTPAPLTSFPNPVGTTVYVGTEADSIGHGHLMALDATTGKPIRPDFLTGKAVVGAIIGGNNIYVAADGLYSINMSTGLENWVINQSTTYYELGATSDTVIVVASIPGGTIDEAISAIDGSTLLSYTGIKIQGGYYYAAQRVIFNTMTPPPTRPKLFVFLQGISSDYNPKRDGKIKAFDGQGGLYQPLLKANPNAMYLMFSYSGFDKAGMPLAYTCKDTFYHTLLYYAYVKLLVQINTYLNGKANVDVYLVGHSMGGLVAMTLLTYLDQEGLLSQSLPGSNGAKLKGIITLDSPLGGLSEGKGLTLHAIADIVFINKCEGLQGFIGVNSLTSIRDIMQVYAKGKQKIPYGAENSIGMMIDNVNTINEKVFQDADKNGINVLTVGNMRDYLYNQLPCFPGIGSKQLSSQWVKDLGSQSGIYARVINFGRPTCGNASSDIDYNHGQVLHDPDVATAVVDFVNGNAPNNLPIPSLSIR